MAKYLKLEEIKRLGAKTFTFHVKLNEKHYVEYVSQKVNASSINGICNRKGHSKKMLCKARITLKFGPAILPLIHVRRTNASGIKFFDFIDLDEAAIEVICLII